jgi:two-component system chemotaxis response regulator CheY
MTTRSARIEQFIVDERSPEGAARRCSASCIQGGAMRSKRTGIIKPQATPSILVVDDSSTMRAVLTDMLSRLGYRDVELADSGATAIEKIRSKRYSLVISDWHMDAMNGPDLLKAIGRQRMQDSYRFIFMTADKTWGTQADARMSGGDAFLVKPFTAAVLKATIEKVLEAR